MQKTRVVETRRLVHGWMGGQEYGCMGGQDVDGSMDRWWNNLYQSRDLFCFVLYSVSSHKSSEYFTLSSLSQTYNQKVSIFLNYRIF